MAATKTIERPPVERMKAERTANKKSGSVVRSKKDSSAPHCRFCDVELQKNTSTYNFEDKVGHVVDLETARSITNYQMTKTWRYNNEENEIYACNFWDGESYGYAGESLFCSKTCGHNFGRVVAVDLPEVTVNIKVRG